MKKLGKILTAMILSAVMMIIWVPALVSAAPGTAAPVSAVFEGVWSPYLEEGDVPGID